MGIAYHGFGANLAISTDSIVVGYGSESVVDGSGAYAFHKNAAEEWFEDAKLVSDGTWFTFVAADANRAVAGMPFNYFANCQGCGSVRVFRFDGAAWLLEQEIPDPDAQDGDNFGRSVAIDGSVMAIAAPGAGTVRGTAYVFRLQGASWAQEGRLTPSAGGPNDGVVQSVAVDADLVAEGTPGHDCSDGADCGSVFLFRHTVGGWAEEQRLGVSEATAGDKFGASVSLDAYTLVVGAPGDSCAAGSACGAAYVYRYDGASWTLVQKLVASDETANAGFGESTSISGNRIAISAAGAGNAYVFEYDGTNWLEAETISDAGIGSAVALKDNLLAVGARFANCAVGGGCGATYLYTLTPNPDCNGNGVHDRCDVSNQMSLITEEPPILGFVDLASVGGTHVGGEATVTMPFVATALTSSRLLRISNKGGVALNPPGGTSPFYLSDTNFSLPSPNAYAGATCLLPYWDDLNPTAGGGLIYNTIGTAPARIFAIQWDKMAQDFQNQGSVTFQLQIFETPTNGVLAQYLYANTTFSDASLNDGASATIGYQRDAQMAFQWAFNTPSSVHPGVVLSLVNGDRTRDGILDTCDCSACTPNDPGCHDCQPNGIRDDCDVESAESADINGDGIPDECQDPGVCCAPDGLCIDAVPAMACGPPASYLGPNATCASGVCGSTNIVYVDANATGPTFNGTTWCSAYKSLAAAINVVSAGTEIRVADGTYKPALPNGSRSAVFLLKSGVALRGGFAGCGAPNPDARNTKLYPTILSGDLNGNDGPNFVNNGDNSYHVVGAQNVNSSAMLDGVTITAGNANGAGGTGHDVGGGLTISTSASPTILDTTIIANKATYAGGGARIFDHSSPNFINCRFLGNRSTYGAGASPYYYASPVFLNCLFSGNAATNNGGAADNFDHCEPRFTNCTVVHNTSGGTSGGLWMSGNSSAIVTNCILWNNTDAAGPPSTAQIDNETTSSVSVSYSLVEGGWPSGTSNYGSDPLFQDSDGEDNTWGTVDDAPIPILGSPAIDSGNSSAFPAYILTDIAGKIRRIDDEASADCGVGIPPVIDRGAYEFGSVGACCLTDGTCNSNITAAQCANSGGTYRGDGSACASAECRPIPTVSQWGVVVLSVLTTTVGTIILRRKCAGSVQPGLARL